MIWLFFDEAWQVINLLENSSQYHVQYFARTNSLRLENFSLVIAWYAVNGRLYLEYRGLLAVRDITSLFHILLPTQTYAYLLLRARNL